MSNQANKGKDKPLKTKYTSLQEYLKIIEYENNSRQSVEDINNLGPIGAGSEPNVVGRPSKKHITPRPRLLKNRDEGQGFELG